MRILVCMKQVPDTTDIKIDPKTNTLKRDGVPSIMNPDDKTALEVALRLKDEYGAEIAVISMGPPQAEIMLREALAMGADEAYLMTDRAFAGRMKDLKDFSRYSIQSIMNGHTSLKKVR